MNKKELYETIMRKVSKEVKKALNEMAIRNKDYIDDVAEIIRNEKNPEKYKKISAIKSMLNDIKGMKDDIVDIIDTFYYVMEKNLKIPSVWVNHVKCIARYNGTSRYNVPCLYFDDNKCAISFNINRNMQDYEKHMDNLKDPDSYFMCIMSNFDNNYSNYENDEYEIRGNKNPYNCILEINNFIDYQKLSENDLDNIINALKGFSELIDECVSEFPNE